MAKPKETPAMKLRERILNSSCLATEDLVLDNWDGVEVEVRAIGLRERTEVVKACSDENGDSDISKLFPMLVQKCLYDKASGNRIFAPNDLEVISELDLPTIQKVVTVAARLLGLDLGLLEKNFEATQNASSSSASPSSSEA